MSPRVLPGVLLVLALASCASAPPAAPDLAGRWEPVQAQLGGQEFPVDAFDGAMLVLTEADYEFGGDKGTYSVLSTTPPAAMDIHGVEGPNAGSTIPAIYELAGDRLTICYQLGPGDRPSEFATPEGTQLFLVHYERAR